MKRLVGALFTLCIGALALADTRIATEGERTAETLKQLERDWADAEKAGDGQKIGRIVADDWSGVDNDGRKLTKEQLIAHIKSGKDKTESVELGPMDVKVLGDAAVVQGSDIEEGTANGEHTSVEIIWMDVFANRDGKWVCVRSQSARAHSAEAEMASRPRWPI
jgi:ketosteroid isomerase-like protein